MLIGELGSPPAQETSDAASEQTDDLSAPFGDLIPFGDPSWYQGWDSLYYNDSHRRFRARMREFVEREIMPYCDEWDEAKQVPRSLFVKCAEAGIMAGICGELPTEFMTIDNIFGVPLDEFDIFHEFILGDELCRCGSGGVLWGICGGFGIGLPPVLLFAANELRQRVAPEVLAGRKTICLAITEPYAGSDVASLRCEAKETPDGEHFIVNGEKKWITNGAFADYFTVAVRTGGEGMGGLSLLLIERTMPGVKTRQMQCSGVWSSGTAYITFEDVKVPKANLIGKQDKGFKYIMYNFNHERLIVCMQATRCARVCLEEAIKYASKRETFGKPLIEHQVIRHKLADMARRIEATHAWMEQLLYQSKVMSHNEAMVKLGGPIALLKVQATQTFEFCAREAAQVFGGLAYTRGGQGGKIERLYREVRAYAIPGGSEEIMTDLGMKQSLKVAQFLGAKI
ncbi:putative acyl-CoA dehydrogenase [Syncephalis pseudoplumigaleata]|uniref:Putative acyl-CoA dehydrogenase n=1 Tax=Syncephalis pseudoplumigaleata TaxID=1712513 RepID=A0A4V1J171_9FUNG|nr:putative acyl-CoA dehydrogenase [Syncephalis pseudoplumigaleata]|eukprot:RKP24039.1 putative acyl-CoA dehydrogenase [Syncephalis pseudoplumigaleata]